MDQCVESSRSSCSPMQQPSWHRHRQNQRGDKSAEEGSADGKCQHRDEPSGGHSLAPSDEQSNEKLPGCVEIEAAVKFLTDVIKNSGFSKQSTENFRRALTDLLKQHYDGHWYPKDPFKGSGYRCLRVNGLMNPILTKAAQLSGLPLKKFRHAFPVELTVWVDPGDVSVRFGEDGSIGVYYAKVGSSGLQHDHQQMEDLQNLARQAPRRAITPPGRYPPSPTSQATTVTAPGVQQSKFHRYSPPTVPSGESPLSSSFVFSPYDGKSVRINAQNVASYSSSAASPDFHQSPSRKYQAVVGGHSSMGGVSIDRRTPPLNGHGFIGQMSFNQSQRPLQISQSPPRPFGQQQQQQNFYNGSAVDSSKNHGSAPYIESMDFESLRRTPPAFGASSQQRGGGGFDFDSSPPSWWAGHQQQQPMGDYQFYNNAHLGSAYNNQAVASNQRRFVAGRPADAMGVVNC